MPKLNEKNSRTEKIIHIMVTSLCVRDCKHCCNKQYNLNDVPYVTDEELKNADTICLTGGEPFLFSEPCAIAKYYKNKYSNIKKVYVYTNAAELSIYLKTHNLKYIDGVNVSIKTIADRISFENDIIYNKDINKLTSNLLYVFDDLQPLECGNFKNIKRVWQEDFEPADDSIFRKI